MEVRGLTASYTRWLRRRPALSDVTLDVSSGSITALVGPNGSGKTTLLRVLLGFLAPEAGTVRVAGVPPAAYRRRHGVAYLPEGLVAPEGWAVGPFFERGAELAGLDASSRGHAVSLAWQRCGLDPKSLAGLRLGLLSKGMQRRTLLAFALIGEPRLVLLDEPLSSLDPEARARLRQDVERLRDDGRTVLFASHDLAEVERLADRVVVLGGGRMLQVIDGALLRARRSLQLTIHAPEAVLAALAGDGRIRRLIDGRFQIPEPEHFDAVARAVYEAGGWLGHVEPGPHGELERVLLPELDHG